jgi:tetratricopeptide (TPR) repeat protein
MKRKVSYIVGLMLLAAFSRTGWAAKNVARSSTVPPSGLGSGLIRSPNPIDRSGNLVITGNVRGGRYFRGIVPYRATSDFTAATPSSSLDSFIRDSAGSEDYGGYTGRYQPYYSPSRTVTTTMPGSSGVIRPPTTSIGGRDVDRFAPLALLKGQALPSTEFGLSLRRLRPMATTPQELERLISFEIGAHLRAEKQTAKERQAQTEQFKEDQKEISDKTAEVRKSLSSLDETQLSTEKKQGMDIPRPFETPTPKAQIIKDKKLDVYEQMKRQIDSLEKHLKQSTATEQTEQPAEAKEETGKKGARESPQTKKLFEPESYAARAKAIMGPHKTFASFSEDKFNQYLRAAEEYLKQGKYYRAADAYTLASIYKPDDPLAYAGKSHALFASGEYMSSALFLSRALEIFPEYAQFKIDIEAMVGDRDKLESRVADVEEWLEKSDAGELWFLLGYVHYQMGRLEEAKKAINAAYEKMPESSAVITLKKAIETAINR